MARLYFLVFSRKGKPLDLALYWFSCMIGRATPSSYFKIIFTLLETVQSSLFQYIHSVVPVRKTYYLCINARVCIQREVRGSFGSTYSTSTIARANRSSGGRPFTSKAQHIFPNRKSRKERRTKKNNKKATKRNPPRTVFKKNTANTRSFSQSNEIREPLHIMYGKWQAHKCRIEVRTRNMISPVLCIGCLERKCFLDGDGEGAHSLILASKYYIQWKGMRSTPNGIET